MLGRDIVMGVADLATGAAVGNAVEEQLGGGWTGLIGGALVGSAAGTLTHQALNAVDKETGIVSDLGGLVDDVFSIF